MKKTRENGSQKGLRPYQISVHTPDDDRDLAERTDTLIQKLAEASGKRVGGDGPRAAVPPPPSAFPRSYHDDPETDVPSASATGGGGGPDLHSPYRGSGPDAPPGYEFAASSYHDASAAAGEGGTSDASRDAVLRAEEEARRMAEAAREMTGRKVMDRGGDGGESSELDLSARTCVRSIFRCLTEAAEGTLGGYAAAPDVGYPVEGGVAGASSVSVGAPAAAASGSGAAGKASERDVLLGGSAGVAQWG